MLEGWTVGRTAGVRKADHRQGGQAAANTTNRLGPQTTTRQRLHRWPEAGVVVIAKAGADGDIRAGPGEAVRSYPRNSHEKTRKKRRRAGGVRKVRA